MRILTRYVYLEVLKVFLVTLTALTLTMIVLGLWREAHNQGLKPAQFLQIIPFILPDALRYTVPSTILFATCSVYGRMAGSNEVVALKSLGITPMVILWPVFILSFLLSLSTVWLNDMAVSWGREGVRRVVVASAEEIVYSMLQTHRSYAARKFSIIVKKVEGRKLIQPIITLRSDGKSAAVTLSAEEAEIRSDSRAGQLTIVCRNGTVDVEGQARLRFQDEIERVIPLADASTAGQYLPGPSSMSMRVLPREIANKRIEIEQFQQQLAAKAAYQMLSGDFTALAGVGWHTETELLKIERSVLCRLRTEPHRRWSNGFSCLCFVLIGAPLAIRLRNSDFLTSFFACFLPILVIYYPLLAFGVDQSKSGVLPPVSVWLGNLILFGLGVWLLRRVIRY